MRYRSVRSRSANRVKYSYLDVVLDGFDRIDPKSIQPTIQPVFHGAGLPRNVSTENYIYGMAREIRARLSNSYEPFTASGEQVDTISTVQRDGSGRPLTEGAHLRVLVDMRERNSVAIRRCKELHGVKCFGCGFDFEAFYGPIGKGYIHVHHVQPISSHESEHAVDPKTDLVPLCPNCHAMVHHGTTVLSIDELKKHIENTRCVQNAE